MFEFVYPGNIDSYQLMELSRVFPEAGEIVFSPGEEDFTKTGEDLKRNLYNSLSALTGEKPPWGTLTGVRPVKLARKYIKEIGAEKTRELLESKYLLSEDKIRLLMDTALFQENEIEDNSDGVAIYVGIPFCRTRCLYCSFPSEQGKEEDVDLYLAALKKEILYVKSGMKRKNWKAESIYV